MIIIFRKLGDLFSEYLQVANLAGTVEGLPVAEDDLFEKTFPDMINKPLLV